VQLNHVYTLDASLDLADGTLFNAKALRKFLLSEFGAPPGLHKQVGQDCVRSRRSFLAE